LTFKKPWAIISTNVLHGVAMMKEHNKQDDLDAQDIQIPHLLFKVKGLLEVAKQYLYTSGHNLEARQKIEKALNSIQALPQIFEEN